MATGEGLGGTGGLFESEIQTDFGKSLSKVFAEVLPRLHRFAGQRRSSTAVGIHRAHFVTQIVDPRRPRRAVTRWLRLSLRMPIMLQTFVAKRTSAMHIGPAVSFFDADLYTVLDRSSNDELDALDFGVIGIDEAGVVQRYNSFESKASGLSPQGVLGQAFFSVVAQCMNNFMVAQRFEDALASGSALDDTIDYVLTLRMRPIKVKLRLLAAPGSSTCYVLVQRKI